MQNLKTAFYLFLFGYSFLFNISVYGQGQAPPIEWQVILNQGQEAIGKALYLTKDGGTVMVGDSRLTSPSNVRHSLPMEIWVMKMDKDGRKEWENNYGTKGDDYVTAITQTADMGFALAGTTGAGARNHAKKFGEKDALVIKINALGSLIWQKNFGGTDIDQISDILEMKDGRLLVAGWSYSFDEDLRENNGGSDFWLFCLDKFGNLDWSKNYGGEEQDKANSICENRNGGIMMVGSSRSFDDQDNAWGGTDCGILKLNDLFEIEWYRNFGGRGTDEGKKIVQLEDGNFLVLGFSTSDEGDLDYNFGGRDIWVFKLSPQGKIIWQSNYGGSENEIAYDLELTTDGGFIITGDSYSHDQDVEYNYGGADIWVAKFNKEGKLEWQKNYGGSQNDYGRAIQQNRDNGYTIVGTTRSEDKDVKKKDNSAEIWAFKLESLSPPENLEELSSHFTINLLSDVIYANFLKLTINAIKPSHCIIEIEDSAGKNFYYDSKRLNGGDNNFTLLIGDVPNGKYILKVKSEGKASKKEISIEKL